MFRALAFLAFVTACHPNSPPELRVLDARHQVVYVQVTNPAPHAMRLDKLDYKFEAAHQTVAQGELPLGAREVPGGSTVIVEVPLETDTDKPMQLTGQLTAELDEIVRIFSVSAQIQPH
jgi:hypothetical protein